MRLLANPYAFDQRRQKQQGIACEAHHEAGLSEDSCDHDRGAVLSGVRWKDDDLYIVIQNISRLGWNLMRNTRYVIAAIFYCLSAVACKQSEGPTASIDLVRDGAESFRLVINNKTSETICVPALYADSSYGNLYLRKDGKMLPSKIHSEQSQSWNTAGPYFVIKPNVEAKLFYNMTAYDVKAGERYQYLLTTSYIKCADVSTSKQAVQDLFVELETSGAL